MNFDLVDEMDVVDEVYGQLARAALAAQQAAEELAQAKFDLARERAAMIVAGLVEAKNEATREAYLRERLSSHYVALAVAERESRQAQVSSELAQLKVDRVRLRVRLMELAAGQERLMA
jgi:hypothetical protein